MSDDFIPFATAFKMNMDRRRYEPEIAECKAGVCPYYELRLRYSTSNSTFDYRLKYLHKINGNMTDRCRWSQAWLWVQLFPSEKEKYIDMRKAERLKSMREFSARLFQ